MYSFLSFGCKPHLVVCPILFADFVCAVLERATFRWIQSQSRMIYTMRNSHEMSVVSFREKFSPCFATVLYFVSLAQGKRWVATINKWRVIFQDPQVSLWKRLYAKLTISIAPSTNSKSSARRNSTQSSKRPCSPD